MDTREPVRYCRRMKSPLAQRVGSRARSGGVSILCLILLAAGCATSSDNRSEGPVTLRDESSHPAFSGARHEAYDEVFRGWHELRFPTKDWVVQGALLKSLEGPEVDLITRDKYESFILDVDWKVSRGANSGILYGVTEETERTFWSGPDTRLMTTRITTMAKCRRLPPGHCTICCHRMTGNISNRPVTGIIPGS